MVDYRANRLVDELAKKGAKVDVLAAASQKLIGSAKAAAKYALATLGHATFNANNHTTSTTDENGKAVTKVVRDSSEPTFKKTAKEGKKESKPPKLPDEFLGEKEIEALLVQARSLQRFDKRFGRAKRKKKAVVAPVTPTLERVALPAAELSRYTFLLAETARSSAAPFESQSIFLNSSTLESEPSCTPLEKVAIFTGVLRARPTRASKGSSSSRKETDRAVYSLLRESR